jgi:hypothetical protein
MPGVTHPSIDEVERIAALKDPALRNLQITQCYHELSRALAERTGPGANWCTFATWASKQAGQSIREEDLRRTLEGVIDDILHPERGGDEFDRQFQAAGVAEQAEEFRAAAGQAVDYRPAVERLSDAVGRGNKKVFEEIGRHFARFEAELMQDAAPETTAPDEAKLQRFCDALRPGEPPDGQRYLRQAFTRYYRALFSQDPKTRAELLLCANIEIGLHEQTRLQPEIAEALDAAFISGTQFTRRLLAANSPFYGLVALALWWARRLLGRPTASDRLIQALLRLVQERMRQAFTDLMMTIRFPPDRVVRLGDDLRAGFPASLRQIDDPDLRAMLARLDPTPDSTSGSGAVDWADLPDRLHFIIDLFRCFQETSALFETPFTPEQTADLKAGRMPEGRL